MLGNYGIRHLIEFYNNGSIPRGLGRQSVSECLDKSYADEIERLKTDLHRVKCSKVANMEESASDVFLLQRVFSLQQDAWSSRASKAFLGIISTHIVRGTAPWIIQTNGLGCLPWPGSHTAENCLKEIENKLSCFGLSAKDLSACTQDTAAASFNTFDDVDVVSQIPCFAHLCNLFLKHGVEDSSEAKKAIASVHDLAIILKGNNSSMRNEALEKACTEAGIRKLKMKGNLASRWNENEAMITRFVELVPALNVIDIDAAFSDAEARMRFQNSFDAAMDVKPLLCEILPILRTTAQWVQVLSSKVWPTISLVRLACKSIQKAIHGVESRVAELRKGTNIEKSLGRKLNTIATSLQLQFDDYLGSHYSDYFLYRIAECLDTRTYRSVSTSDQKTALMHIKDLCLRSEILSPEELRIMGVISDSSTIREMSEGARFEAELLGSQPLSSGLKKVSPLSEEFLSFRNAMAALGDETLCCLEFWGRIESSHPILSRIAARVLPTRACSTDVERFFSTSGLVCSPLRSRLSEVNVDKLTTMNWILSNKLRESNTRSEKRAKVSTRFCLLSSNNEIESPTSIDEDSSDDE